MKTIDEINPMNFARMFNIKDILANSVYYPASGVDGTAIECLSDQYNSFVQVDYSIPREIVKYAMENHFFGVGYDLFGIKFIESNELTPYDFTPRNYHINYHERYRLESEQIKNKFYGRFIEPFAYWAVYELNQNRTKSKKGKAKRFSLLHIGGEACATFESLYLNNRINPTAVVIKNTGEGYGDNWTTFRNPEFRFYQIILFNYKVNGAHLPSLLLTNMILSNNEPCFWPDYLFKEKKFINTSLYIYELKQAFRLN